jgi:hypothetical protein
VSTSSLSLVQRGPAECGLSECYGEASIMGRTWPTGAVAPWNAAKSQTNLFILVSSPIISNQQSVMQLTFAYVRYLRCDPRQDENMITVVGNILGKIRERQLKMFSTDSFNSNIQEVTLCSVTT